MDNIVAIGLNYSTIMGVVRSVGMAGHKVRLISLNPVGKEVASKSKYVISSQVIQLDFNNLFAALEEARGNEDQVLILPVHDRTGLLLAENADKLAEHYDFPNIRGDYRKVAGFMDKIVQKKLAKSCGIAVAEGDSFDTTPEGIELALQKVSFPCFVKPSASASAMDSKALIAPCHSSEELVKVMEKARKRNCKNVVIEQLLTIDRELSAYGVAYDGHVSIPACVATVSGGFGRQKGISAEGEVIPAESLGDLREKLREFVRESGLNGLFCIDLLVSNDEIYFSEMNLRCGSSEFAVTAAGVNLPGMLIDACNHKVDIDESAKIKENIRFINEKVVLDSYRGGYISLGEYAAAMRNNLKYKGIGLVRDKQDPGPWREYKKLVVRKIAAKIVKGPQG